LTRYPAVAVIGSMFYAVIGRPTASDRWGDAAELGTYEGQLPDGSASIESWRALLRALRFRHGVAAMRSDALLAVDSLAPGSEWRPAAVVLLGLAELVSGSPDAADDHLADAADQAADLGGPDMVAVALAERAIISIGREEWTRADELAERAVWVARHSRREDAAINGLVYAVAARTALHAGRTAAAEQLLPRAQRRLPQLTYAVPIVSVQTRLELARTYLALADPAGARAMMREIEAIQRRRPDWGTLTDEVATLRSQVGTVAQNAPGASALSAAELRVLPFLATHLTFKEVAPRVYLSRHTVKSHAMSIYRKLDVTSRGAAVERARDIGLL
jgi:LuxR family transcriptional regulator, maltose regulon positive regulatory protein